MKKTTALTLMLVAGAFASAPATAATGSGSTTAPTDTRDYTLTVASAHGNPSPAVGTHTFAWHTTVTASVEAEANGHTCTGWTGTGSVPETGATHTTGDILLDQVESSIEWQWEAEGGTHTVTLHPGDHGSIAEANDGASFVTTVAHGAAFPAVTVVPNAGYTFAGWNPPAPETVTEDFVATAEYQQASLYEQAREIPLLMDHWFRTSDARGVVEITDEGIKMNGSAYRWGNGVMSRSLFDFRDSDTFMKFKPNGNSRYAGFGVNVYRVARHNGFTTNHSFGGSKVMSHNVWYYVHLRVEEDGFYTVTTSTGDYAINGGTVFDTRTGYYDSRHRISPAIAQLQAGFGDNYGGTGAFMVLGEARTTAEDLSFIEIASFDFNDGVVPDQIVLEGNAQLVPDDNGGYMVKLPKSGSNALLVQTMGAVHFTADVRAVYDYYMQWDGSTYPYSLSCIFINSSDEHGYVALYHDWPDFHTQHFPIRTEAESIKFVNYDRAGGGDGLYIDNIVLYQLADQPPPTHTVTFDLDGKGERVGGGPLVQQVAHGEAAEAPEVEALPDWTFTGWDRSFNNVTTSLTVKALYTPVPRPDLSLSAADLRILNAAGAETWNPAIGEAVTVEVTLRNTGEAATSGDILVQLFLDGAPADLSAYDLSAFTVAASTVVAESMSVGGSRTLLLPWTATGPDRVATLTAVAEFAANRAQSQANAEGASEPLPVAEVSFANNSVGRSLQIGSPAAGEFGIEVDAEAPADMVSGVSYTLTGTARYDWGANEPVLGALVTVTVGDTTHTARTVAPDGAWSVALPGLPEGNHLVLVQVHDGRLTGSTPLTLVVSAGPETRDLRITEFGFVSGAYRVEGQTAYAAAGDSLVLQARVRNDGNAPCGPFEVAFKDPAGTAFSTVTVPELGAFSSVWVEADAGWMVEAGTHTLSALADSAHEIEETNEHNNSRACTVIGTAALPDLAPVSISFAPGGPKAGDTVTISTVIENRGGAVLPAGAAFDVLFSVNGEAIATETVAPASDLAPGASLTVSTTHTFSEHGAFTVGVLADSGDAIAETREDNNALSRTLTVRKALPDLRPYYHPNAWTTVSGLSFSPSQPVAGEAVTVSCDIYNAGTVPLGAGAAFDVRFSAGDTPFATERVILGAELPVGGKVTVTTLWNGGPAGPVTIAADVDTEDEIEEEHETNNRTTRGLTVFPADAALVAASLTTSPLQPLPGAAVTLTATVRNDGGAAGGAGAVVEFFAGSTDASDKIGETTLDADIAPKGGTATAAFAWSAPATPGVVTIFAKVGDSTAQRNLTVTANPAPNLQVFSEDIAFDPPLPLRGASVTVSATVRNTEGSAATDFLVRFYVEAPGIGFVDLVTPVTVASLAVGAETTVQANAPIIAERSAYTVKVELVPNPEQGDADASDNAATSSFVLADTPVADAGADTACIVGQTATLDGTASRNATAYVWTLIERPAGSEAELAGANTATPSLTPDLPGLYRAQLIVSDGLLQSTPDTVAITAHYLTLEVASAHGEPDPAVGIHSYTWQAAVDVQSTEVDEVDPGRTRHLCTGWVGSGSVPTEGDAATVSFTIAEDSTLTWQWATEHWLQVDPEGSGTVSVESGWQAAGSNVVLTATPDADHRFIAWSGDIEDCVIDGLEITAPMTGPRSLTATFVSALHTVTLHQGLYGQIAGADGGGAYTVTVAYGNAFPEVNVTPSAGFLFAGWSPAAPAVIEADFEAAARYRPDANVIAMAAAEILASAHAQQAHDLYTPEALRHLFPSPLMIEVDPVTGEVHIDLQMQWSDDLSNWQPFGEILRWTDAETGDKRFYRLQLMEPLSDE